MGMGRTDVVCVSLLIESLKLKRRSEVKIAVSTEIPSGSFPVHPHGADGPKSFLFNERQTMTYAKPQGAEIACRADAQLHEVKDYPIRKAS